MPQNTSVSAPHALMRILCMKERFYERVYVPCTLKQAINGLVQKSCRASRRRKNGKRGWMCGHVCEWKVWTLPCAGLLPLSVRQGIEVCSEENTLKSHTQGAKFSTHFLFFLSHFVREATEKDIYCSLYWGHKKYARRWNRSQISFSTLFSPIIMCIVQPHWVKRHAVI